MTVDLVKTTLNEALEALQALIGNQAMLQRIAAAGQLLADTFAAGGRAYSCGNGGSMCDAMHFAEELTGRFRDNRPGYAALSISDASHLSCVGNDYGYDQVFARFIEAHGRKGDVLLAISTSGTSKNVLAAVDAAHQRGMKVIGMTGPARARRSERPQTSRSSRGQANTPIACRNCTSRSSTF